MKILVLGGTGTIGCPLIELLSKDDNNEVFVTSREDHKSYKNIKYIKANAHKVKDINNILINKYDCIIDLMNYSFNEFKALYELYLNNTNQYIFFSSARVYADKEGPINENDPRLIDVLDDKDYLNSNDYSLEKAREEDLLLNSKYNNYVIIRPSNTYNDERLKLDVFEKEDWLYRVLNGKKIIIHKGLLDKYTTYTYAVDVANYIYSVIGNNESLGEIYNVAYDEMNIKWEDILNIYKESLKKYNIELKYEISNKENKYNKYHLIYDRYYDRVFDCSKINKISKYRIKDPIEKSLKKCVDNFMKTKKFKNINYRTQAYIDKELNDYTKLKDIKGIKNKIKYFIYRYIMH